MPAPIMSSTSSRDVRSLSSSLSDALPSTPSPALTTSLDPLDGLVDFSAYDTLSFSSPRSSPATKTLQLARPVAPTPALLPSTASQPALAGPSHQYDLYRQQTGIPQGSVASTLAVNSQNAHLQRPSLYETFLSPQLDADEPLDHGPAAVTPAFSTMDLDMDFESPSTDPAFFFPESSSSSQPAQFVDPQAMNNVPPPAPPSNTRAWPGMHQQQAQAKAQAQAQAQAQQRHEESMAGQGMAKATHDRRSSRAKAAVPDPFVEEKITQLLNAMRQNGNARANAGDAQTATGGSSHHHKKDVDDMDEDERLLASEEGKKLTSKERRQLRNKVSARAFRSRRKEYITQLEGEIATKSNENRDLRLQNQALMAENTRLSDFTRMLLSSPEFNGFLANLSNDALPLPSPSPVVATPAPSAQTETGAIPKDVNPYNAQQAMQQQSTIDSSIFADQAMDMTSGSSGSREESYVLQPQVYSVFALPESSIDIDGLRGKGATDSILDSMIYGNGKAMDLPTVEVAPVISAPACESDMPQTSDNGMGEAESLPALFTSYESSQPQGVHEPARVGSPDAAPDIQGEHAEDIPAILSRMQKLSEHLDMLSQRLN